jgi:hypothetical protein
MALGGLASVRRMRQEWLLEDLIESWTLVEADWKLIGNKAGVTRLGFTLLLKFYEIEDRFPVYLQEVPGPAVDYLRVPPRFRTRCGTGARQGWPGPGCPLRKPHRRGAAPLPVTTSPTSPPRRGGAVDWYPQAPRTGRASAASQPPRHRRWHRACSPSSVPAHDGTPLARRRAAGTRPDAPRRMALTANGRPLRRVRSR